MSILSTEFINWFTFKMCSYFFTLGVRMLSMFIFFLYSSTKKREGALIWDFFIFTCFMSESLYVNIYFNWVLFWKFIEWFRFCLKLWLIDYSWIEGMMILFLSKNEIYALSFDLAEFCKELNSFEKFVLSKLSLLLYLFIF